MSILTFCYDSYLFFFYNVYFYSGLYNFDFLYQSFDTFISTMTQYLIIYIFNLIIMTLCLIIIIYQSIFFS